MAIDSLMLSVCLPRGQALWRFYGWSEPSITFGYSQQWEWVQQQVAPFEGACIRRITGGGIVDHRNDLTYALAIPASHRFHRRAARELYEELHQGIADAFMEGGVEAVLAPYPGPCGEPAAGQSGICFQSPEPFDVLSPDSGAKIAGAAMKRNHKGILIQGSISRSAMARIEEEYLMKTFATFLERWLEAGPSEEAEQLLPEAIDRELARFISPEWNQRR
jgi:lipoate-protein ligase A